MGLIKFIYAGGRMDIAGLPSDRAGLVVACRLRLRRCRPLCGREPHRRPEFPSACQGEGAFRLLKPVRKHGVCCRCVSAGEVCYDLALDDPALSTEEMPGKPSSPCGSTKAAPAMLVRACARAYGLRIGISNRSNSYGPYRHVETFVPAPDNQHHRRRAPQALRAFRQADYS